MDFSANSIAAYIVSGELGLVFVFIYALLQPGRGLYWRVLFEFIAYTIMVVEMVIQVDNSPFIAFGVGVVVPILWPALYKLLLAMAPSFIRWYVNRNLPDGLKLPPEAIAADNNGSSIITPTASKSEPLFVLVPSTQAKGTRKTVVPASVEVKTEESHG